MSAQLTSLSSEQATFPIVDCLSCGGHGLAYVDFDEAGEELLRCLRCDTPAADLTSLAGKRAVERLGYAFLKRTSSDAPAPKLSGCGTKGVKSCGSGGCSSGSCGTGGGCSSGGCGSR